MESPLNITKITVERLLLRGLHVGQEKRFLHRSLKPYLLGLKGGFTYFHPRYLQLQLKLMLHTVYNLTSLRQRIFITNHYDELGPGLGELLRYRRVYFWQGGWVGGFLTNFKKVRLDISYPTHSTGLPALAKFPSLMIFLNPSEDNWGLKEAINLNIPCSQVTGSSFQLLSQVLYPITGSGQTADTLIFYSYLIGQAARRGVMREKLKIMNEKHLWVNI